MRSLCHLPTGFRAPAAGFGALPTVIHVGSVFFALGSTCFADVGAKLADIGRVNTTTGHERNGGVTDFSAITVESDAVHHHLHILFRKTGFGTGIAANGAILAGINTVLILLRS